jgi:hypothetical protein
MSVVTRQVPTVVIKSIYTCDACGVEHVCSSCCTEVNMKLCDLTAREATEVSYCDNDWDHIHICRDCRKLGEQYRKDMHESRRNAELHESAHMTYWKIKAMSEVKK